MRNNTSIQSRPQLPGTQHEIQQAIARQRPEIVNILSDVELRRYMLHDGDVLNSHTSGIANLTVVLSGCLKRSTVDSTGDIHVSEFYFEGDIVGLDAIGDPCQCSETAAYDTVCLATIFTPSLTNQADSVTRSVVMQALSDELCRARTLAFYVTRKTARTRLAWFIHSVSERRHSSIGLNQSLDLRIPMPRSDIASHLGLAAETVSREFTRLGKQGVIAVNNRNVRILKPDTLRAIAELDCDDGHGSDTVH